jgi:hypothetical protein
MRTNRLIFRFILGTLLIAAATSAQTPQKIVDHGPDGEKKTFVVLGDGYSAAEQAKFASDVDALLIKGVFGHDFYKGNFEAFNVYRIDLVSSDSGVSTPSFAKNTALKVIYNGVWNRCWLEESKTTDALITKAAAKVPKYDYVLILANETRYGGCRRGSRLYVTSGSGWNVVAHEYGHAIAGLYDEYPVKGAGPYNQDPVNANNCSTVPDRNSVVWHELIDANTVVPSDNLRNIDANNTVGEFTGCNYAETKIYRPVRTCRMHSVEQSFCPVCLGLMHDVLAPFLTTAAAPPTGFASGQSVEGPGEGKFVNIVVRISRNQEPSIVKATEVTGRLVSSQQAAPPYFFTFSKDATTNYADFVPEDPYLVRGFADPEHPEKGEKLIQADSATIIVNVPRTDIASATHDLGMQLYKVGPVAMGQYKTPRSSDLALVDRLMHSQGVTKELDLSKAALGSAIQAVEPKKD